MVGIATAIPQRIAVTPLAMLVFLQGATAVPAPWTLADALDYACAQPAPDRVECDYRPIKTDTVSRITAQIRYVPLPAPIHLPYPNENDTTAVLFLIDTGAPDQRESLEIKAQHIKLMAAAAKPHHRIGLTSFHGDPRLSVPLSAAAGAAVTAAEDLVTEGKTAEEFGDASQAIEKLARYQATRKAIVFLSDGQADARAYYHPKLIAAARNADVMVYVLAYPGSEPPPGLEALRRLATESSGGYIEAAPPSFSLPNSFAADPFKGMDNGGHFTVDLRKAIAAGLTGPQQLDLRLGLGPEPVTITVPVDLSKPVEQDTIAASADTATAARTPLGDTQGSGGLALIGSAPAWAAWLIVLLVGGLLSVYALTRRRRSGSGETPPVAPNAIRAYLIRHDAHSTRYAISKTPWRIGRSKDNELTLNDNSVSRHHAEILSRGGEGFMLRDLDSLNGVFVDDQRIQSAALSEGCEIEVGDVAFTFTLQETEPLAKPAPPSITRARRSSRER